MNSEQLKKIIKEELQKVLKEDLGAGSQQDYSPHYDETSINQLTEALKILRNPTNACLGSHAGIKNASVIIQKAYEEIRKNTQLASNPILLKNLEDALKQLKNHQWACTGDHKPIYMARKLVDDTIKQIMWTSKE